MEADQRTRQVQTPRFCETDEAAQAGTRGPDRALRMGPVGVNHQNCQSRSKVAESLGGSIPKAWVAAKGWKQGNACLHEIMRCEARALPAHHVDVEPHVVGRHVIELPRIEQAVRVRVRPLAISAGQMGGADTLA